MILCMHPATLPITDLLAQCEITRTRRGGPGGQHRNKVETAVVVVHQPSGVRGQASERRSQDLNRQEAIHRLRVNLALSLREGASPGEEPTPLWQSRTRGGRLAVSAAHDDFPALLAEALDQLAARDWNLAAAAEVLRVTSSQLVKFLQLEPLAMAQLNEERRRRQLKALK
jgi:hypothetical protein